MGYREHKKHAVKNVNCAVLTVSSTRTKETDESGKFILSELEKNNHNVIFYEVIRDDKKMIRDTIMKLVYNENIQAIISNGGTGIGKKDFTTDTVEELLDKRLEGFGEIFRYLSYKEIGSASIMSRAVAGVIKNTIIISLPGSIGAVKLAMKKIVIPELGHMVWEVNR